MMLKARLRLTNEKRQTENKKKEALSFHVSFLHGSLTRIGIRFIFIIFKSDFTGSRPAYKRCDTLHGFSSFVFAYLRAGLHNLGDEILSPL